MRLLLITQTIDREDSALGFFHRWVIEFARQFDSVSVICLREGSHALPENVRVYSLGKEKGISRLGYLRRFYSLIFSLRGDYDAVFVHMNPEYVVLGGLFWRLWRKKVVLWYLHKSVDLKLRAATLFAHVVATGSKESFRIPSGKVQIIGHGIDVDQFAPREAKETSEIFSIVTAGRISPSKDYETLLRAVADVPRAELTVIGAPATESDVKYESALKVLVESLGLEEKVVFRGPVSHDDVVGFICSADVFVNTSKTGSLDKAVLEAMSCGVPPLTSNTAFADMLGPYGLMFREGDAGDLAAKLSGLEAQKLELPSLGMRLRDIVVRHHGLPQLVGKIKQIYETGR